MIRVSKHDGPKEGGRLHRDTGGELLTSHRTENDEMFACTSNGDS